MSNKSLLQKFNDSLIAPSECKRGKSSLRLRLACFVLSATMLWLTGCRGSGSLGRRPELATRPYNDVESQWHDSVKNSYPQWKSPQIPVATREPVAPVANQMNQPPPPQSEPPPAFRPAPVSPSPSAVKPMAPTITSNNASVLGYSLQSQPDPGLSRDQLPAAILDVDPPVPSSGKDSNKGGFKIIPDSMSTQSTANYQKQGKYYHVVQKGETLRIIARKFYGDENAWKKIYDANRSTLSNPNKLKLGMSLLIP